MFNPNAGMEFTQTPLWRKLQVSSRLANNESVRPKVGGEEKRPQLSSASGKALIWFLTKVGAQIPPCQSNSHP